MANYLSNAFSLQMLTANATLKVAEIPKEQVPFDKVVSGIGHKDIADLLGVPMNRVNTRLKSGDILYVAQYIGDRLPEGCTKLPENAVIKFYQVTFQYDS